MPAVLSANLHSGFLNEGYGLFLLRQIAAVAPVGRAEDFGIDAVVTLLPFALGQLSTKDSVLRKDNGQENPDPLDKKNGPANAGPQDRWYQDRRPKTRSSSSRRIFCAEEIGRV